MTSAAGARPGRSAAVVTVACVLLQLVLGGHVSLFGAVPDFLLVAVFFVSVRLGQLPGVLSGFGLGLLFDLVGSSTVGLSSLMGAVFGYAVGALLSEGLLGEPVRASLAFLGSSFAYSVVLVAVMALLGTVSATLGQVVLRAALAALLEAVLALVVFALYARLTGRRRVRLRR